MTSKVFITCLNFQLRDEVRAQIAAAADKLFRQELHVANVRLTLEGDYNRRSQILYKAVILLELRTSEIVASAQGEHLLPTVVSLIDDAERQLLERFYLRQRESTPAA